ncbi:MAG: xanthine dehydrogenase family protein subunit M [Solirubrobacteraceae bacterium]
MRPFAYARPDDPAEAVAALREGEERSARFLGGGTNLVDLMKLGVERPEMLVDVTHLGLDEIAETDAGGLSVGAAVTNSALAADTRVRERYPVLSQALVNGASGQLRNLATVAGNLLQRTRCVYFQDVSKPCNKRHPGSGCPAREGEHRNLAVLGHSAHCIATHPSDMAVALTALDTQVHVLGVDGPRSLVLSDLYRLPGEHPERETTLAAGELITAIELAPLAAASNSRYVKVRERRSYAFALVSVAAALELTADGTIAQVRLALGGVAPVPWRAVRAQDALRGARPDAEAFRAALDAELEAAEPLAENAYKVTLVRDTAVRALLDLSEAA